MELADALDSKSSGAYTPCGFDSHLRHQKNQGLQSFELSGRPLNIGLIMQLVMQRKGYLLKGYPKNIYLVYFFNAFYVLHAKLVFIAGFGNAKFTYFFTHYIQSLSLALGFTKVFCFTKESIKGLRC